MHAQTRRSRRLRLYSGRLASGRPNSRHRQSPLVDRPASRGDRRIQPSQERAPGFTLIELVTTLSVALVLLTIAVPNFSTMINNNTLSAQSNDLVQTLALARSEALTRKATVVLCKSNDELSCSVLDSAKWEQGWIMFVDTNGNRSRQNAELLMRTWPGLAGSNSLRSDSAFTNYIAFLPDGRSIGSGNTVPPVEGEFRLCDERGKKHARVIEITPIGRAKVKEKAGADQCP
jgi:type IV fimbrial biogenesis protein FimT